MDTLWQIQMLGRLSARRGDRVVTRFASSRTAALLARLAFFPQRAHPREELIDLLWPNGDLDTCRPRLRVVLASLRRQLEPPDIAPGSVLVADRNTLRLHPDACHSDVAGFEAALRAATRALSPEEKRAALDQAIALYTGEFLPGFYDEWIVAERERLESLYEDTCERQRELPAGADVATLEQAGEPKGVPGPPDERGFPLQFTRLFGREQESAQVAAWLRCPQTRLVTLTGPGGAGKTRLAAHAARGAAGGRGGPACFAGPVCFVPLADLAEARLIPDAILGALALPRSATQGPLEQVVDALSGLPPALLVLDNFEHLVERGAPLVSALLTRLPGLTCLITSRRRLALPGEREYPVPPLPLPDANGAAAQIARAASAQLFVDRAQAARPDFQLTPSNAAALAALCRSLEGIPLAIELVAARAMTLTPAQMMERLGQRFALLTSRRGDKGTRHRSLWAALEWSYDLLPPSLGRFFTSLSVFRSGTSEAAQSVCEQPLALEFLTQLRERSLLVIEDVGEERRFRLLETLREFGAEHLPHEEKRPLARRHAAWFIGLAEEADPRLTGPEQAQWLDRLEADHENLRRALAWWLSEEGGADETLRMAGALWRFWAVRGHYAEGRGWLEQALARRGGSAGARAKAANGAGNLASEQADYPAAEGWYTEALAMARGLGHTTGVSVCLCNLGRVAMHREDYNRAQRLQEEALALRRADGDKGGIAFTLQCQAFVAQHLRDYARARRLHEESLALWREVGNDGGRMWSLCNLAAIIGEGGDDAAAARLYAEALGLCLELGDRHALYGLLGSFAALAARRGDWGKAATLAGASESLRCRTGAGKHANEAADFHAALAPARDGLGAFEYAAAWDAGAALTADQAVTYALEDGARLP